MPSGFFALLDDIGALMDDLAVATKLASQKTAGILGDDLAVNAEKSVGFISSREIPVLWSITKGSLLNKIIIIPAIFLLNILLPFAIKVILIIGGAYLAYEGAEKVIEYFFHKHHQSAKEDRAPQPEDRNAEKRKIKSAIRTDFILSLEIVIIALSTVLNKELWLQIITVSLVALIATVGVYGIVALIVRMDDAGLRLIEKSRGKGLGSRLGRLLVNALPIIIKLLSVVGTIALLMVAGGLFLHNVSFLHKLPQSLPEPLTAFLVGLIIGTLVFLLVWAIQKLVSVFKSAKA